MLPHSTRCEECLQLGPLAEGGRALRRRKISLYLIRIIISYLLERRIRVTTEEQWDVRR